MCSVRLSAIPQVEFTVENLLVCIQERDDPNPRYLSGPCLISRNPVVHPGDSTYCLPLRVLRYCSLNYIVKSNRSTRLDRPLKGVYSDISRMSSCFPHKVRLFILLIDNDRRYYQRWTFIAFHARWRRPRRGHLCCYAIRAPAVRD